MRTFYFSILTLLFMTFSNAQNSFSLKKDHDAIMVKDLKASAKFYGEVLGLKEIPNGGLGDQIRWFDAGNQVQLHLIENKDNFPTTKGVHMALSTNDLDGLMKYLKSNQVHFENWPGEPGVTNNRPDGIKQIYLQDPDGYWIEINDNSL